MSRANASEEFQSAIALCMTMTGAKRQSKAVLIHGPSGSAKGKVIEMVKNKIESVVIVSPTADAALLAGGTTIHRLFHFPEKVIEPTLDREKSFPSPVLRKAKAIIIDQVDQVRADWIDGMDYYLRRANRRVTPFGGLPVILVGDPFNPSPVLMPGVKESLAEIGIGTHHFFGAKVWNELPIEGFELTFDQLGRSTKFAQVLGRIRDGSFSDADLENLNQRVVKQPPSDVPIIAPTKLRADQINNDYLRKLSSPEVLLASRVQGEFDGSDAVAPQELHLKNGALVQFLTDGDRHHAGDVGTFQGVQSGRLVVRLSNHSVHLQPKRWERFRYNWNSGRNEISRIKLGELRQYPINLGWAVEAGEPYDRAFDRCFVEIGAALLAPGLAYRALSKARSMEGLHLSHALTRADITVDERVRALVESSRGIGPEGPANTDKNLMSQFGVHRRWLTAGN